MADPAVDVRPLDLRADPAAVCAAYGEPGDVVLVGRWAGGGAIVASDPLGAGRTGFAAPIGPVASAIGGGWFGAVGFSPGPEHSAGGFYPNVLRFDAASGVWTDEALPGTLGAAALERRRERAVARLRAAAGQPAGSARIGPFVPNLTRAQYVAAVRAAQEHIRAGDIYQVNLCLQLVAEVDGSSAALFAGLVDRLRPVYGAHLVTARGAVVSASPELFLRRTGRHVRSSPIKGTRPRAEDPETAALQAGELTGSAKDRAENVMIVDMVRNDLARIAATGSVRVTDLLRLEAHPGVWHLVSDVTAELADTATDADLLRAAFPPGSVTGAPKQRALQIIDELEPVARGVYTGAIGYRSPVGGLELNVAIRTLEIVDGVAQLGVGAGITAGSEPDQEWRECLAKAAPIVAALGTRMDGGETSRAMVDRQPAPAG